MRPSETGLRVGSGPGVGQRFVMVVRPPAWYAGKPGDGAIVQQLSADSVYVLFDSGLRDSFPLARFAEYFRPAEPEVVVPRPIQPVVGPWVERTPSGRILLHR